MAKLFITNGPSSGETFDVIADGTVIGRQTECDIVINGQFVSRRHAKIYKSNGAYFVEDLQSSNGTMVNGDTIAVPTALNDGDEISIQALTMKFISSELHETEIKLEHPSSITNSVRVSSPENFGRESELNSKLRAIMTISRNLGRSLTEEEIFEQTLSTVFSVFPTADRGLILTDNKDDTFDIRFKLVRKNLRDSDPSTRIFSHSVARRVIDEGEALIAADSTGSNPDLFESSSLAGMGIQSMMCAPIVSSVGTVMGVIQLDRKNTSDPFTIDDLELLAAAGILSGQAIENSQLQEERIRHQVQDNELQLAKEVQKTLVPQSPPEWPGYSFHHLYKPVNHLGGDCLDYIPIDDYRIAVAVGDVSGKNVSASLLTARLHAALRVILTYEEDPKEVVVKLNESMCNPRVGWRFVTFLLCIIDSESHVLSIVNAGHIPPLLKSGDQLTETMLPEDAGPPLGIKPDAPFQTIQIPMQPGDSILMVTDGVTECGDLTSTELYGLERLSNAFARSNGDPEASVATIVAETSEFCGDAELHDDYCVVSFSRNAD